MMPDSTFTPPTAFLWMAILAQALFIGVPAFAQEEEVLEPLGEINEVVTLLDGSLEIMSGLDSAYSAISDYLDRENVDSQLDALEANARAAVALMRDAEMDLLRAHDLLGSLLQTQESELSSYSRQATSARRRAENSQMYCDRDRESLEEALAAGTLEPYGDEATDALIALNSVCADAQEALALAGVYDDAVASLRATDFDALRRDVARTRVSLESNRNQIATTVRTARAQIETGARVDAYETALDALNTDTERINDTLLQIEDALEGLRVDTNIETTSEIFTIEDLLGRIEG